MLLDAASHVAPDHFPHEVRNHLAVSYPGWQTRLRESVAWHPSSPDFGPLDFFRWCRLTSFRRHLGTHRGDLIARNIFAVVDTIAIPFTSSPSGNLFYVVVDCAMTSAAVTLNNICNNFFLCFKLTRNKYFFSYYCFFFTYYVTT